MTEQLANTNLNITNIDDIVEKTIVWNDINFPKQFPLFHYKPEELAEKTKNIISYLKASFIIVIVIQLVNLLDTIISVGGNYYPSINVLYVFLDIIMVSIFYGYLSYIAYRSFITHQQNTVIIFYILIFLSILIFFALMIINEGSINGILKIITYAQNGEAGAIICFILGVLEIIGYIVMIILQIIIIKKFTSHVLHY